jgi:hypothetical protein
MAQVAAGGRLEQSRYGIGVSRAAPAPRPMLWRPEDLLRWGVVVGLGGIVVAVSWYICAGDVSFSQQIGPTDAALAGLLLAGIGNVGWLLRGRRILGERRRALLPDVPARASDVGAVRQVDVRHGDEAGTLFVAGDGMERFHRSDCLLASGRHDWTTMTRAEHEVAGRRPCGVCRP